jgi:hypothetical protein
VRTVSYQKFLDNNGEEKLVLKIKTNRNGEIDMIVQYESYIGNQWTPVVRYDCSNGFFHRDLLFPEGEKEKQIISISTLEESLNFAELDIKDRWEFYKEFYLNKLKK